MGYRKTAYTAGDYKVIRKTQAGKRGRPGPRAEKREKTREAVERENRRRRQEKVQLLIMANFSPGDLYIDLTYRKEERPGTVEEAKAEFAKAIRKVKALAKKAGEEIRWIVTTEVGARGAAHHHLVINYSETIQKALVEAWGKGRVHFQHVYDAGDAYAALAAYMVKQLPQGAEGETGEEAQGKAGAAYSRSRNLIVPQGKTEEVDASDWRKEPKAEKGYVLLPGSVEERVNPLTGLRTQRYVMQKIRPGGRPGKGKG